MRSFFAVLLALVGRLLLIIPAFWRSNGVMSLAPTFWQKVRSDIGGGGCFQIIKNR